MHVHANRATRHERQRMRAVLSDLRRDRQGEANSGEASVEEEVSLAQLCRRLTLTLTLTLTSRGNEERSRGKTLRNAFQTGESVFNLTEG